MEPYPLVISAAPDECEQKDLHRDSECNKLLPGDVYNITSDQGSSYRSILALYRYLIGTVRYPVSSGTHSKLCGDSSPREDEGLPRPGAERRGDASSSDGRTRRCLVPVLENEAAPSSPCGKTRRHLALVPTRED
ncbi:hypothetical protein BHM03_00044264 [Ensete ventricosum]|uniref:Uncharacterized protein n=1 Tax=Ensete ventricosum TaxID=4639 RepID=A0A445MKM0_ENSVE|nr:hypothetical protein BHM03_00044264 [Ensete ventricosum]